MSFYYLLDYICFLYALLEQKQKFFFISEFYKTVVHKSSMGGQVAPQREGYCHWEN